MRNENGFTLVEGIIAFALLSMGMMVAVMSFTAISRLQSKGATSRDVQQNSRYVLESIVRDVRNATIINAPSSTCLMLTGNQNLIVTYYYANSSIMKVVGNNSSCSTGGTKIGGTVQVTSADFSVVTPASGDLSYVKIGLTVKQPTPGLSPTDPFAYEYRLDTTVAPRSFK